MELINRRIIIKTKKEDDSSEIDGHDVDHQSSAPNYTNRLNRGRDQSVSITFFCKLKRKNTTMRQVNKPSGWCFGERQYAS